MNAAQGEDVVAPHREQRVPTDLPRQRSGNSLRPAAKSIMFAQHLMGPEWVKYEQLVGEDVDVKVDFTERLTIHWGDVGELRSGSCELIMFPTTLDKRMNGFERGIVEVIIYELASQHGSLMEGMRDQSGAGLVHNLLLANNEASLRLAMGLFDLRPSLLVGVHEGGRGPFKNLFDGEGSLHVLAVNQKGEEIGQLLEWAHDRCADYAGAMAILPVGVEEPLVQPTAQQVLRSLLLQKTTGNFFSDHPMNQFGSTPLAYAAFFGLSNVFEKLFFQQLKSGMKGLLTEESKHIVINGKPESSKSRSELPARSPKECVHGYFPIHAAVASGRTEMYDLLVDKCGALSMWSENCPKAGRWQVRA